MPQQDSDYTQRFAAATLLAAGVLLYWSFGYTEMAGSDLWWHIAAGRAIVDAGTPWLQDMYSYSFAGRDWFNPEWLSDVVFYGWTAAWGAAALVYWKWLLIIATFALLQQVLARQSGSPLAGLLCAVAAVAVGAPFLDIRPHLYSLFGFSLLLWLLLERRASPWLLAPLFIVWANLHGGFFFGLMVLSILIFPWRNLTPRTFGAAFLLGLLCVAAALLTPWGYKAFLYPLKYAFEAESPFRQLAEWHSPFAPGGIRSPLFFVFMWLPAVAVVYLLPRVRARVGFPWEGLALTALTLAMALTSRRFIPLFGVSLAVLLAPAVGLLLGGLRARPKLALALALVALVAGAWRLAPYPQRAAPAYHYLTAEYIYPVDTLNFIEANGLSGRVFAYYNWGGYIHWRTGGRLQVYIDGRADTLYDADTYINYVKVLASAPGWLQRIEATAPDFILWPHAKGQGQAKLQELLATGRWQRLYRDSVGWLLVRRGARLPDTLVSAPEGPWREMSIAMLEATGGSLDAAIEHATNVRREIPWHRGACALLADLYQNRQEPGRAAALLDECRAWFPSAYLR